MTIETIERGGYVGTVSYDEYPENPREMYGMEGTYAEGTVLIQLSNGFLAPSKADKLDDAYDLIREAWNRGTSWNRHGAVCHDIELVKRYARAFLGAVDVQWWDDPCSSSRIFGMVCKLEDGANESAILSACLAEYAAWCEGEVYTWQIENSDGEFIDGCGGFYGDEGYRDAVALTNNTLDCLMAADRERTTAMFRDMVDSR